MSFLTLLLSVTLGWDPSPTADVAYHIYRSTEPGTGYVRLTEAPIDLTTFTDTKTEPGVTYYYVATAVGPSGLESGYSNVVAWTKPEPVDELLERIRASVVLIDDQLAPSLRIGPPVSWSSSFTRRRQAGRVSRKYFARHNNVNRFR